MKRTATTAMFSLGFLIITQQIRADTTLSINNFYSFQESTQANIVAYWMKKIAAGARPSIKVDTYCDKTGRVAAVAYDANHRLKAYELLEIDEVPIRVRNRYKHTRRYLSAGKRQRLDSLESMMMHDHPYVKKGAPSMVTKFPTPPRDHTDLPLMSPEDTQHLAQDLGCKPKGTQAVAGSSTNKTRPSPSVRDPRIRVVPDTSVMPKGNSGIKGLWGFFVAASKFAHDSDVEQGGPGIIPGAKAMEDTVAAFEMWKRRGVQKYVFGVPNAAADMQNHLIENTWVGWPTRTSRGLYEKAVGASTVLGNPRHWLGPHRAMGISRTAIP